jgi:anti-sigma factor RsiW
MSRQIEQMQGRCLDDGHISATVMDDYIRNELSDMERERVESRLAECELCLELFMGLLEAVEATGAEAYPDAPLPDMQQLEDRVITALYPEQKEQMAKQPPASSGVRRRPHLLQHPAAQYAIAASITLLLLGSGSFSTISQRLAAHDQEVARTDVRPPAIERFDPAKSGEWSSPSWSDRMVDQTSSWLDGLQSLRYK